MPYLCHKSLLAFGLFILLSFACASAKHGNDNRHKKDKAAISFDVDGPYVFLKKDRLIVKTVKKGSSTMDVIEKEYPTSAPLPRIKCEADSEIPMHFDIQLRSKYPIPPSKYDMPEKLFAISDIEGDFTAFIVSLRGNNIVDGDFNWSFGKGHLVLNGDFFDRGTDVTACLWLIYKLEAQAEEAGGKVHFIVGNHEEMNLRGDLRYLKPKYKIVAKKLGVNYTELYGKNTVLGRWLRSKNIAEKIGRHLFVHGGMSPYMASYNLHLEKINDIARRSMGDNKFKLSQTGIMTELVFGNKGPMWFRGYFKDEIDQQEIDNVCAKYGVDHIVVGHTIVSEIGTLYNGKIIAIDVKHNTLVSNHMPNALWVENGENYKVNLKGKKTSLLQIQTTSNVKIFTAIRNNDLESVKAFLKQGNDINGYYTNEKYTLLHYSINHNKLDIIRYLLEEGANPNLYYGDKTALMFAIKLGREEATRLLIENGVNVNTPNYRKKTALYYVAKYCPNVDIAKLLVEKGATLDNKDYKGRTPLEYAVKNDNKEVANFLKTVE